MGALASGIAAVPKVYDTASKAFSANKDDEDDEYTYDTPGSTTSARPKKDF
jgi:hypothetical protein